LYKLANALVQQWQHFNQLSFHLVWKGDCQYTLKKEAKLLKYAEEVQEIKKKCVKESTSTAGGVA
jgi:hypothetical protein